LPSFCHVKWSRNRQKVQMHHDNDGFSLKSTCGLSYQACPIPRILHPSGMARFAGTGGSLSFLIPRRRRDG
jgi:hypothetical protein